MAVIDELLTTIQATNDNNINNESHVKKLSMLFNALIDEKISNEKFKKTAQLYKKQFLEELQFRGSAYHSQLPHSQSLLATFKFISSNIVYNNFSKEITEEFGQFCAKAEELIKQEVDHQYKPKLQVENNLPIQITKEKVENIPVVKSAAMKRGINHLKKIVDLVEKNFRGDEEEKQDAVKTIQALMNTLSESTNNTPQITANLIRFSSQKLNKIILRQNNEDLTKELQKFQFELSQIKFTNRRNLFYSEETKVSKVRLDKNNLIEECVKLLSSDEEKASTILKEKILRTVASSIFDLPEEVKNKIANNAVNEINANQVQQLGEIAHLTEYSKKSLFKETKDLIEENDDNISIKQRIFKAKLDPIKVKIDNIVDKIFEKLKSEKDERKNFGSLVDAKSSVYSYLSSMFRSISLTFGAEKNAKELFADLANIAQKEQKKLVLDFTKKNKLLISGYEVKQKLNNNDDLESFVSKARNDQDGLYRKLLDRQR